MTDTAVEPKQTPNPVKTSSLPEDRILLEGPHSRLREARLILKAVRDFIIGFRAFHFCGPCVTAFAKAIRTISWASRWAGGSHALD